MSGTAPRVSVVVPCRNERHTITAFIENLRVQECVPGSFEVIIADGMSDDGTRQFLAEIAAVRGEIRVIDNPAKAVSPGLNAAIAVARGEIVIRMDVHTVYSRDYIRCCVDELERTGASNVGGPALTKASGYFQRANAAAYGSAFAVGGARFHQASYEGFVDTVPYGCWRRDTLYRIGFFDENLIRNQDDELNLRLIRSGGTIWQSPRIRSWYRPRSTAGSLFRQYYQYGYWKVAVIRKHKASGSWRHFVPGLAALCGFVLLLASFASETAAIILATGLALWFGLAVVATVGACRRTGWWDTAPILPIVFGIYHLAYGLGFVHGVVAASLGHTKAGPSVSGLTR